MNKCQDKDQYIYVVYMPNFVGNLFEEHTQVDSQCMDRHGNLRYNYIGHYYKLS